MRIDSYILKEGFGYRVYVEDFPVDICFTQFGARRVRDKFIKNLRKVIDRIENQKELSRRYLNERRI